jgi:hypothetical protein
LPIGFETYSVVNSRNALVDKYYYKSGLFDEYY